MRGYDLAHTPRRRIAMVAACPFPAPRGSQVLIRDLAHALVCPRSSWSGFPIKLINYMATGRAIVAADGSAKGIVHGETGLTFRNGSAAGMAAALLRLYDDPALRQRLGENARVAAPSIPRRSCPQRSFRGVTSRTAR